jgi:hypothetical protein
VELVSGTASVFLDEIDVTNIALEGSATRALNRPSTAQVKLPMGEAFGGPGSLLKVYFQTDLDSTPVLFHHGRVLLCETSADENNGYTVYNSTDPLELWKWRPVRDPDAHPPLAPDIGNAFFPSILKDFIFGPQIVQAMMVASEGTSGGVIPGQAEGPLFLTQNSFAGGTIDLSGAPADWPMTMAQLATLLVSTGVVDIVITPIELTDSGFTCGGDTVYNYGQIDVYNGDYGNDLTSSVAFQYGMGLKNIRGLRWNEDMTNMCNKLWTYLGPAKDEFHLHWSANITGDDLGLAYPPGGQLSPPGPALNNQIGVQNFASRCAYGVRMEFRIQDDRGNEANIGRELWRRQWQMEQWLRAQPQTLIHITPTRDSDILEFDIGDLVLVEAVPEVKGGFSGAQRVYEYTIGWDTDSVLTLGELQVSADGEGFD